MTYKNSFKHQRSAKLHTPDPMTLELGKIQRLLIHNGYKIRRSVNDSRAWRVFKGKSESLYLIRFIRLGEWEVLPKNLTPERTTLAELIQEALQP